MAQDIFSYISEAYASGMTKDEMISALRGAGWEEADIYRAFADYESPQKETVQSVGMPAQKKPSAIPLMEDIEPIIQEQPKKKFRLKFSKKVFATLGVIATSVTIVIVAIGIRTLVFQQPGSIQFSLQAQDSDIEGIDAETIFFLKASRALSEDDIKKFIAFTPAVEFSVKKIASATSWIPAAYAAEGDSEDTDISAVATYEIKPTEPLLENKIYRVAVTDDAAIDTDKEYQWAFQVKAPFQVISTHPGNHTTYAPLNTGIEMTFNREDVLDPQSFFDISPKVDGTFERHKKTFVFLPKGFSEKTVYTVTLKKGLRTTASGETFADDYVFSFETGEKEYTDMPAWLNFSKNFGEFIPSQNPVVELNRSYDFDLKKERKNTAITVFSFASSDDFLTAYRARAKQRDEWAQFQRTHISDIPESAKKEFTFTPNFIEQEWQVFTEFPKKLGKGYYLFQLSHEKSSSYEWAVVTPLTHYYALSGKKSLLWLYDFQSKKPIAQSAVSVLMPDGTEESLGATRDDGLLEFTTPTVLQNQGKGDEGLHADFFKVTLGEDEIFFPSSSASDTGASYWSYISSDRYTYQMTDTIRFWGVLKGKDEDLRGKKAHIELRGGDAWIALVSADVVVSQFDTVQGELSFQGVTPGYYTLEFFVYDRVVQSIPVEIMTYVKPTYLITVTASRETLYAGDSVEFSVKAAFFDGTPVSGGTLAYSGWWIGEGIEGNVKLDEKGEGKVSYTPRYTTEEWVYPQTLELTFRPVLSEEGDIWGSGSVLVFGPSRHIQTFNEDLGNGTYRLKAKVNLLNILLRNEFIGAPTEGEQLTARVIRHTYKKKETGQQYDPMNKTVRKVYDYWIEDTPLEIVNGKTDTVGEWTFEKTVSLQEDSWYEIVFKGKDEKGRTYTSSESLWHFSGYNSWKNFALSLEKKDVGPGGSEKQYTVGEKVRLAVHVTGKKKDRVSQMLFFRTGADIEHISIQHGLEYEDTFQESFIPVVHYRAVGLGPYGFEESNEVATRFFVKDRELSIGIAPDKETYRPGDLVTLDISVQDKNKNGVMSEVNLAAIDESLYHMLPYSFEQNMLDTLYMSAESTPWIATDAAQYVRMDKLATEGGGCFTGDTPILMADGSSKHIKDIRVGDRVMTFASEHDRARVSAIVQGISWHRVNGYLIVNGNLEVTPEHRMLINSIWQPAGVLKKGDILLNADGEYEMVLSVEYKEKGNATVYNIVVGTYHTYFAGDRFVHNQEKGGGDTRARQKFEDTALYESVRTDDSGRSRTTFTAPDNITSWRVRAQGFAPDGIRAGQTTRLIPVSLPFFIDATIARTYLTGDDPTIRVRVFGSEFKQDQDVEFTVKSDTLTIDKKEIVKGSEVSFTLGSLPEGHHELTISASQGMLMDSIIRPVTVARSYFRKYESVSYDLAQAPQIIEGKKDGYTDLAFMDMSSGKYYDALHKNFYESGIRIDQVAGASTAAQFLSRYFEEELSDERVDLSAYQHADKGGGIGLFPYSDPDVELTAKIADLSSDAVAKEMVRGYLEKILDDEKADISRISKALYGLSVLNEPVLVKVKKVLQKADGLSFEDRVYLALALARFGDFTAARETYEKDIRAQLRFDGPQAWLDEERDMTARVKLTGVIGIIASELGYADDANVLWEYMRTHDPERDLDTLEELLFMRSELEKEKGEKASFAYQTAKRKETVSLENGTVYRLTLSADELQTLRFSGVRGKVRMIASFERERNLDELAKSGELSIRRAYLLDGRQATEFKDGDMVQVRIDPNIADSALDGTYQVVDYLPSGLKPITQTYQLGLENTGTECDPTWYPVRVQNNAVYFLTYKGFEKTERCTNRTINYYARVVTKGTYSANPSLIQSMENLESLNVSQQDTVTIK